MVTRLQVGGQRRATIWVGTSGWNYPHWRGKFYPEGLPPARWFEHYAGFFSTVEINNTFYQLPEPAVFRHWRKQAPPGFLYAVKANRFLTHVRRLKGIEEPLSRFLERARLLGGRLGPILFQLPPRWKRNLERLEGLLRLLRGVRWRVVEFRDADWLVPETFRLLRRYRTALCVHDLLAAHPREITSRVVYVRFHGAGERYGGCYGPAELEQWAQWMWEIATRGRHVFAYFNNDANAYAVQNALELAQRLQARIDLG